MKKYEFTGETKICFGKTLHRIRAIRNFADVAAGEWGGWIEDERNLSHEGNAWVGDNAKVSGNAWVGGNAQVCGNALINDNAWIRGDACVCGDACVSGEARVSGDAWVCGDALIDGNAWIRGNAWVGGDVWVGDNARVCGDACVGGDARVGGEAAVGNRKHILWISMIGSEDGTITFMRSKNNTIIVKAGIFSGSIDEFAETVKETHGDNEHAKAYALAIELAKLRIELSEEAKK